MARWFPLKHGALHQTHPLRSPEAAATTTTSSSSSSFPTQLALENEWETYVSPFLLLAAAEVLYAKLTHLQPSPPVQMQQPQSQPPNRYPTFFRKSNHHNTTDETIIVVSSVTSLMQLYQRIDQDLRYIQEILCEPFLRTSDPSNTALSLPQPPFAATQTQQQQQKGCHYSAATSVTDSIRALSVIVSIRCQMITLQALIFAVTSQSVVSDTDDSNVIDDSDDGDDDENTDRFTSTAPSTLVPTYYEAAGATTIWLQSVEAMIVSSTISKPEMRFPDQNDDHDANETKEMSTDDIPPFAVLPLLQTLQKELKAWKYCFETCAALERCQ